MPEEKQPRNLREALKGKLSEKEMRHLITSFNSLGNIAVIQVPRELEHKAKAIGEALLQVNKHFKTACMATGERKGRYRVQPMKVIAGKKNKIATYKESGCVFKVDLGKVFFSPRLSTERLRIAKLIKEGEVVGALFAGVGPFPIVFAKHSGMRKAYAIELNPPAFKGMLQNIKLNKCEGKVEAIQGDVKTVVPKMLAGKCDRVSMPLPKGGENFLHEAFIAIKPSGGVIHFYAFIEKEKGLAESLQQIKDAAKEAGRKVRILQKKKVCSFSASIDEFVIDFMVMAKD